MPVFRVWGKLLSGLVPPPGHIGRFVITRDPSAVPENLVRPSVDGQVLGTASVMRPDILAWSECGFYLDLPARSSDDAQATVLRDHVPAFMFNLSWLYPSSVPVVELIGAHEIGPSASLETKVFSRNALLILPASGDLTPERIETMKKRLAVREGQKELKKACEYLFRARWLGAVSGGDDAIDAAALLAYFQAIEVIVQKVRAAVEATVDTEAAVEAVVQELTEQLPSLTDADRARKAIKHAQQALDRLDVKYLDLKIKRAADELQLGQAWIEETKKLMKLRNGGLGHGGHIPTRGELNSWLRDDSAEGLVLALLKASVEALA